jgi:NTP pyrophosphatase (non-canonical NTP hydrolase)
MDSHSAALSLDDVYKMVSYVFHEKNERRSLEATYAHLVEVCGLLVVHQQHKTDSNRKKIDSVCKVLAWYFPMLAKARVRSAEDLIFRKFPRVCPYCRQAPHMQHNCKAANLNMVIIDYHELRKVYGEKSETRPRGLRQWQQMFQDIYPRTRSDIGFSATKLFEELGELAEAIRVIDNYPNYFLSEAADVFSYLMGIANEIAQTGNDENGLVSIESQFLLLYSGMCRQCKSNICVCPHLPASTVGRIAKEIQIGPGERLFQSERDLYDEGRVQAERTRQLMFSGGLNESY